MLTIDIETRCLLTCTKIKKDYFIPKYMNSKYMAEISLQLKAERL